MFFTAGRIIHGIFREPLVDPVVENQQRSLRDALREGWEAMAGVPFASLRISLEFAG